MNVPRAILPYFRNQKSGKILNTTSLGGMVTFPLFSLYNATKWAVEGFMESLQFEVKAFNIYIKNIEPGSVKSDFKDNKVVKSHDAYTAYSKIVLANIIEGYETAPSGDIVAKVVYKAANENNYRLRYAGTPQAKFVFLLRGLLPHKWYNGIISGIMEKGSNNLLKT